MKSTLAIWLVLSFTAIAVFGFLAMDEHMMSHKGCLASTAAGAFCPNESALGIAFFHINVFKNFSLASLLLAFLALFGMVFSKSVSKILPLFFNSIAAENIPLLNFSKYSLRKWLALREISPAI